MSIINSESSDWNTFLENREVCWFRLLWKYTWSWMVIVLEVVSEHALQDGIIMHTNCLHASLNNVFPHFVLDFSFNIYFFFLLLDYFYLLSPCFLPVSIPIFFFFLSTLMHFLCFFLSTTSSWEMRYFSTGMYTKSCRSNTTVRVHTLKITLQRVLTQTFFLPWNWLLFVEHCQHTQHCVI